jgi:hypothetical protein
MKVLIAIWVVVAILLFAHLYGSAVGYERLFAMPVAAVGASLATGAAWMIDCSDPSAAGILG